MKASSADTTLLALIVLAASAAYARTPKVAAPETMSAPASEFSQADVDAVDSVEARAMAKASDAAFSEPVALPTAAVVPQPDEDMPQMAEPEAAVASPAPAYDGAPGTAPQVQTPATFVFKTTFEARTERLTLGELATCKGLQAICEEAYGVDLGQSPEPGKTLNLSALKLKDLLAHEWDSALIRVEAPKGIRITSAYVEVDEDQVRTALGEFLNEGLAKAEHFQVSVDRLSFGTKPRVRSADLKVEFPDLKQLDTQSSDWQIKHLSGTQRVDLLLTDATGHSKPLAVQVQFSLREKLPVPLRNLDKDEIVAEKDLEDDWVVLTHTASNHWADTAAAIIGHRLRRPAPVGQPIALDQLETPLIVKRGQTVHLLIHNGGLAVSGQVRALGSGGYGQTIEAQYLATKKKFRVRIIDSDTVEYLR